MEIDKPNKIVIKFSAVARQLRNRQNYLTIPKQYVDDGYIQIGKEYWVYLEEK